MPRVRIVLVLVLLVVSGWVSRAPAAVTLHPGIKAGLNMADFRGAFADLVGTEIRLGIDAGVAGVLDFGGPVSIESGIYYAQRGAKEGSEATDAVGNSLGTFYSYWKFDYLEIPVLVRADFLRDRAVGPYVAGGPVLAINLKARLENESGGFGVDLSNRVANLDVGVAAGAGLAFSKGAWRYGIEGRYTTGLNDVFEDAVLDTRHSVFAIMLSAMH